jgi:hypothetical protein
LYEAKSINGVKQHPARPITAIEGMALSGTFKVFFVSNAITANIGIERALRKNTRLKEFTPSA